MIWRAIPKFSSRTEPCHLKETCLQALLFCNSQSLKDGICVHSPIIKLGLQQDLYLSNNLLSLYSKCCSLEQTRYLFDEMPERDVVSWMGIMSAYKRSGNHEQALEFFDSMIISGEQPNEFTLSTALQLCCDLKDFDQGTRVQAYVVKHGFESNMVLGTTLIDFYSNCNLTEEAYRVFTRIKDPDVVLWTTILSSFIQDKCWSRALQLYPRMVEAGVAPNEFTIAKLLTASTFLGLGYGKMVHSLIITRGIQLNLVLKTTLVDMYMKCQRMEDAVNVSKLTPECDVMLWTSIISGFAQNLMLLQAVAAFQEMEITGIPPNNYTFSSILNACSSTSALDMGKQIHSQAIMTGLEADISVSNALVDFYMKCSNSTESALRVFRGIDLPNVISWTSLISGLADHGLAEQSFLAFVEMQAEGVKPNSFTLSGFLRVCSMVKSLPQVKKLHGYIIKTRTDNDIIVENALVDVYAGLRSMQDAWSIFNLMTHKDAITYTSLIARLNEMGNYEMATNVMTRMINDDIKMDSFSLASFLSASAGLPAKEMGKQLHCYSLKYGLCSRLSVSNALVDMYGKCGCICDAYRAFGDIFEPDVVSYNGLISGLASNGDSSLALSTFEDMRLAGIEPDHVTFMLVLYACSHGGLVDLGTEYFQDMEAKYDIAPQLDHYVCLVDLFGRAGQLEKAMNVIKTMPFTPDALIYKTLLGACKLQGNIPLGEDMASKALELDPYDPALYTLLATMYDGVGRSDLGEKTRRLMRYRGLKKNPSQSWMEVRNKIHVFTAGDRSHPQISEIHNLISELGDQGYICLDNKDSSYHSEKLAVAFGLLSTPSTAPIHIYKNTRICRDCHEFIMTVAALADREIVVRDANRFHSFKKGACSCRGYW